MVSNQLALFSDLPYLAVLTKYEEKDNQFFNSCCALLSSPSLPFPFVLSPPFSTPPFSPSLLLSLPSLLLSLPSPSPPFISLLPPSAWILAIQIHRVCCPPEFARLYSLKVLNCMPEHWAHVSSCDVMWAHVRSCEPMWAHVRSCELMWVQVMSAMVFP